MKKRNFIDSLNDALNGIIISLKKERNIKIDFIIAILVFGASIFLGLSRIEIVAICIVAGFVIAAEMFNTAIENMSDLITKEQNEKIKLIKDTSAGAVLIAAFVSIIVGYGVFFDKLNFAIENTLNTIVDLPLHISFATLIIVTLSVIFIKAVTKTGTPLKGGLPSGHAAIASATAMIIWILTRNVIILLLTLVLTILVIHSRVEARIHTLWESILGVTVGMTLSTVIFGICNLMGIL